MIEVIKVLNTSVVLVNFNGQELIALGKGIGFNQKPGALIDSGKIDKLFYSVNNDKVSKYIKYAEAIPSIFFELTQETVRFAEQLLNVKLNNSVYFMLADHLNFAIERFEKNIQITNHVLWEIRAYYPKEFQVGLNLLTRLKDEFGIELPEEEAANIAFHIINARQEQNNRLDSVKSAKIINNIVNIIKYSVGLDESNESVHFQRFITHVRFFVERILTDNMLQSEDNDLYDHVYQQYSEAVDITNKIESYLRNKHEVVITNEEKMYIIIHVDRLIKSNGNR